MISFEAMRSFLSNEIWFIDWIEVILLGLTLWFLIKYTRATEIMKDQTILQAKALYAPVLVLCIRNTQDYMKSRESQSDQQAQLSKFQDYLIHLRKDGKTPYYLSVRNVGAGPAFNVDVKGDNFKVNLQEAHFVAPQKDEQKILLRRNDNTKVESLLDFSEEIIKITCSDITGYQHIFRYKIVDLKGGTVKFLKRDNSHNDSRSAFFPW